MKYLNTVNQKINNLFCYFVVYSFIGCILETVYVSMKCGRFIIRGFLYGPFCPIYGFGALILIGVLRVLKHNALLLFTGAAALTTTLEYMTSAVLEFLFHKKWWDYSDEFLNISGRVCLKFSIVWGIIAVVLLLFIHPFIVSLVSGISSNYRLAAANVFMVYLFFDLSATIAQLSGFDLGETHLYPALSGIKGKLEQVRGLLTSGI